MGALQPQVRSERPLNPPEHFLQGNTVYDQLCLPECLSLDTLFAAPFEIIWRLLVPPSLLCSWLLVNSYSVVAKLHLLDVAHLFMGKNLIEPSAESAIFMQFYIS